MKKKYLRVFSVVLSVLMLLSVVTVPVSAAEVIASGTCGDGLTWELDSEYTLTVSGTGAIPDYASVSDAPWEAHIASVKQIIINDGITSIGSNAFAVMFGLEEVTVPGTVETIGEGAFASCFGLREITLPASLKTVEDKAFSACSNLDTVNYFGSEDEWYQISIGSSNSDLEHADIYYDYCPANVSKVHNYSSYVTPATCTEMGYTTYVCDCSKSYVDDYVYPDHTLTYEIIKKPTYLEKGEGIAYCHCGFSYTYTIPVLDVIATGTHGDNAQFTLTRNGTLSITGSGPINMSEGYVAPWNSYNAIIKIINIADGITILGNNSFKNCVNVSEVVIPESVTSIDNYAFTNCVSLKEITITNPECSIYDSADTISDSATIYGYPNSTAQEYAEKYNRTFVALTCQHSNSTFVSSVEATCTEKGYTTYLCAVCNNTYDADYVDAYGHSYNAVVTLPTCTADGYITYTCECGHSYTETVAAADHTDENGDFICEVCGKEINPCSHLCHRNNIFAKIVWKIIIFICEIFGLSKTCACGRSHY